MPAYNLASVENSRHPPTQRNNVLATIATNALGENRFQVTYRNQISNESVYDEYIVDGQFIFAKINFIKKVLNSPLFLLVEHASIYLDINI